MAYTRHGHHIPGTERYELEPDKARCGGPGLCGDCSREVVMVERSREKVETRGNFEDVVEEADIYKFQTKPVEVEAAWFRGGKKNAVAIVDWIIDNDGHAVVIDDESVVMIHILLPDNSYRPVMPDSWVVIYDMPWEIYAVPSEVFEKSYIQKTFPKGETEHAND